MANKTTVVNKKKSNLSRTLMVLLVVLVVLLVLFFLAKIVFFIALVVFVILGAIWLYKSMFDQKTEQEKK